MIPASSPKQAYHRQHHIQFHTSRVPTAAVGKRGVPQGISADRYTGAASGYVTLPADAGRVGKETS